MCVFTLGTGSLVPWAFWSAPARQAARDPDRSTGNPFPRHFRCLLSRGRNNGTEEARFDLHDIVPARIGV